MPELGLRLQLDICRVRLKPDGTRWRTGGEVKGKLANGVGSQYSHTTSEHGVSSITNADAHTSATSSRLNWRPPADLNGLVRFAERRNLVSARVPSRFKRTLHWNFQTFSKLTHHVRWLCDLLTENEVSGGPGHLCNSGFLAFQSYFTLWLAMVPKIASSMLSWTFPQTCTLRLMELCTNPLTTIFFFLRYRPPNTKIRTQ